MSETIYDREYRYKKGVFAISQDIYHGASLASVKDRMAAHATACGVSASQVRLDVRTLCVTYFSFTASDWMDRLIPRRFPC